MVMRDYHESRSEPVVMGYTRNPEEHMLETYNIKSTRYSWIRFIWVVYSVWFFIEPVQRHSVSYWAWFALAYAFFLFFFFAPHFSDYRLQKLCLVGMFVLGLVYVPFNPGAAGIYIYFAAIVPFVVESPRLLAGLILGECVCILLQAWIFHITPWSWISAVFFSLIVSASNFAFAQQRRADSRLRLANEEIEHLAKMAERERIARDLHDVLGHTLSVIVLKSELAGKLMATNPERTALEIQEVEQIARKALAEVRHAIGGYRSEGLAAEVQRAERTLDAAGVRLKCDAKPPRLNPAEETVLSLVVREAVTNIVRHAHARQCRLEFFTSADHHQLTVEDDGSGLIRQEGNGLRGMRERIEALGGSFSVVAGRGTRLTVEIPISRQLEAST
jgi:two-component system sensor histidine kinase DesK